MNNVRAFREEKGWTVRKLAEKAGLPFQTVYNYEKGSEPPVGNARKLAKALRKPLDAVFPLPARPTGSSEEAQG
jgi:transcriptional regulator with XRE-family HTH domain